MSNLTARIHDDFGYPLLALVNATGQVLFTHGLPDNVTLTRRRHVQPLLDAASVILERRHITQLAPWASHRPPLRGFPLEFKAAVRFDPRPVGL